MKVCSYENEKLIIEILKFDKYCVQSFVKLEDGFLKQKEIYYTPKIDDALEVFDLMINGK